MPGLTYTIADLLREQGHTRAQALREQARLRAEAQRANGSGLAQTVSGVGQFIATLPQQRAAQERAKQQAELDALKLQDLRGELGDKQTARQKAAAFQAVLAQHEDIDDALPDLYKVDPVAAAGIAKHVAESKSEALKFQEHILSTERAKADFIHAKLSTEDPGQYTKNLYTLQKAMPDRDWSSFTGDPAQDKAAIAGLLSEATTAKEKIDARMKAIDDARMAAAQQSTEKHQRAMETITAGNTATDNDRQQKALAEQMRHNRVMEARPVGGRGASGGRDVADLVDTVIDNPALFDQLTPTVKGQIAPLLRAKGYDNFGKPLPAAAVKQIAESQTAIDSLKDLREVLKANEQYIGPVAGLSALNPYSGARQAQARIDLVRQRVGKALEGGVLRKEDEEKYKKILATLRDTPETALYKVDSLIHSIEQDMSNFVAQQRLSGRRVSPGQGPATQGPASAGQFSVTAPNGKVYTFATQKALDAFKARAGIK